MKKGSKPGNDIPEIGAKEALILDGMNQLVAASEDYHSFAHYDDEAKKRSKRHHAVQLDRPTHEALTLWPLHVRRGLEPGDGDLKYVGPVDPLGNRVAIYEMTDDMKTERMILYLPEELFLTATVPVGGRLVMHVFCSLVDQAQSVGNISVKTILEDIVKNMGVKWTKAMGAAAYRILQSLRYTVYTVMTHDGRIEDSMNLLIRLRREGVGKKAKIYYGLNPHHIQVLIAKMEGRPVSEWPVSYVAVPKQKTLGLRTGHIINYLSKFRRGAGKGSFPVQISLDKLMREVLQLSDNRQRKLDLAGRIQRIQTEIDEAAEHGWEYYFTHDKSKIAPVLDEYLEAITGDVAKIVFKGHFGKQMSPWATYEYLQTGETRKRKRVRKAPPPVSAHIDDWDKFCRRALKHFDLQGWVVHFRQTKAKPNVQKRGINGGSTSEKRGVNWGTKGGSTEKGDLGPILQNIIGRSPTDENRPEG